MNNFFLCICLFISSFSSHPQRAVTLQRARRLISNPSFSPKLTRAVLPHYVLAFINQD